MVDRRSLFQGLLLSGPGIGGRGSSGARTPTIAGMENFDSSDFDRLEAVDVIGEPMEHVLSRLSKALPLDVIASSRVADQRITCRSGRMSVRSILRMLPEALVHAPSGTPQYAWRPKNVASGRRRVVSLMQTAAGANAERQELLLPIRRVATVLNALRSLEAADRAGSPRPQTEVPRGLDSAAWRPLRRALHALSPAQIEELAFGKRLKVPAAWFPDARVYGDRGDPPGKPTVDLYVAFSGRKSANQLGSKVAYIHVEPVDGPNPGFSIQSADADGAFPILPKGVVDLTPQIQRCRQLGIDTKNPGAYVAALGEALGFPVLLEHFYLPDSRTDQIASGLNPLKGTAEDLVRSICDTWSLRVKRVGSALYFWPMQWASCRQADVAEPLIDRYRKRLLSRSEPSVGTRVAMAGEFSALQLVTTVRLAIPAFGQWDSASASALRLLACLPSDIRGRVLNGFPVPIKRVSAIRGVQAALMEWLEALGADEALQRASAEFSLVARPATAAGGKYRLVLAGERSDYASVRLEPIPISR